MEFRQLKTFITVVKELSFTKAAEQLGYAQSSVTSQIQTLEEEFDTVLFERLGRQIKLTKDGEYLFHYATQILKLSDEAKDLKQKALIPKGPLTIGTAESLCIHRLPNLFKIIRSSYPAIDLRLDFEGARNYRTLLRKNLIDLAILLDVPCHESDLTAHTLFVEPMSVIAPASHPLAAKCAVTPYDLNGEALILTPEGCTYRCIFESILAQAGSKPASVMGVSSNEVIKRFVADGWGIGFLPRIVIEPELCTGELIELAWNGPDFAIYTQLIYHKNKWHSPALEAFINVTLETLQNNEYK